jgi:cyclopropane-fatty-acyl-phospholipid synthase
MAETWIQSYARASVLQVLKRLQHGRLTVTITYQDKDVVETFGADSADDSEAVSLEINSPNVWGRFAQAFALVSAVVSTRDRHANVCQGVCRSIYGARDQLQ